MILSRNDERLCDETTRGTSLVFFYANEGLEPKRVILNNQIKVEIENRTIQQERMKNNRLKQQQRQREAQSRGRGLAGSAIAPDMAEKRLQALQKIRELNALRKSQRGDLNMY